MAKLLDPPYTPEELTKIKDYYAGRQRTLPVIVTTARWLATVQTMEEYIQSLHSSIDSLQTNLKIALNDRT